VTSIVVEPLGRAGDLDGVLEIEAASFNNPTTREWYERELRRPDVCFIHVLRTADHPVAGFCAFWRVADEMHINNLAIRLELRGCGLGSHLLRATVEAAWRMGATRATLEVRRTNEAALRLYGRAGFHQAGVRRSYYAQPVEDALVLVREPLGNLRLNSD
jgi:ribosomal-protein-alanine N-acetyltransferase